MNTLELVHYLGKYQNRGTKIVVCAIDELPQKKLRCTTNHAFVINLSKSNEYGSHWISVFIDRYRNGYM